MEQAPAHRRVFLSYRLTDRVVVGKFAARLRRDRVGAWDDHWKIVPGDDIVAKMDQGIDSCTAGLIFISHAWLEGSWVRTSTPRWCCARWRMGWRAFQNVVVVEASAGARRRVVRSARSRRQDDQLTWRRSPVWTTSGICCRTPGCRHPHGCWCSPAPGSPRTLGAQQRAGRTSNWWISNGSTGATETAGLHHVRSQSGSR